METLAEKLEKGYVWLSVIVLVAFLAALVYSAIVLAIVVPGNDGQIVPRKGETLFAAVARTKPFDQPGVHRTGPNRFDVVVLGQAWMFNPPAIELPVGAEVTFWGTSIDIDHGLEIPGTTVNLMLLPGQIGKQQYRFTRPGEYRMICHEYCGMLHHQMTGTLTVK
ncbi:Heme/copper-type cytochrome oxidase, subunit 2 [Methylacidimicrobium sp. AP8]|uniref:cytochrome c oxidase subunit II n=1 Tax=Methylacidimicrobium sp. AP8 TaxID=2730359 RepID=UPI0018C0BCC7|nr:cytochrome c oxidase subunit II [Methylacidimicrobium sp. AP8]CAB4243020.1 Heme/copper-type cytochrome oxidase, subunit 2 [Methylacidimicrobium sp. AP8]